MGEIIVMPGVERRDMAGTPVPDVEVLQAAIGHGVTDVVVIGRKRDGSLYVASAAPDVDQTVGLLMRAVGLLSTVTIVNDVVITDES